MKFKMDTNLFKMKIEERFDDRFSVLGEYISQRERILIRCNDCKTEFMALPNSLLYEKHPDWCPTCKSNKVKQDFIQRLKDACGDEYIALSEYENCKKKVLFKHNIEECGKEFWMTPDTFFNGGSRCPTCMHRQGANKLFVNNEDFIKRIENIHKEHIIINSEYHGYDKKVNITHIDCGRSFDVLAGDLLQGKGCRYCGGTMHKTHDIFTEQVKEKYDNEYTVLGKYINAKTNILVRHNSCGHEWEVNPTVFLSRRMCPYCNKSNGEKEIENFAIHNKLNYKTQETFDGCCYNDYLKFDMSIYNHDNKLLCLIEYDGINHFEPVQFGGISLEEANENLRLQKIKDSIKNEYCKVNNIRLLRISYLEYDNIYDILKQYLLKECKIKTRIPNIYHKDDLKTPAIKFIDLFNNLPNGIYEKQYFKNLLLKDRQNFSTQISNKPVVKQYLKDNNIEINKDYVLINKPNNDDFEKYIEYGISNSFDFEVFNNIKNMIYLKDGTYGKYKIGFKNKATVKSDSYDFYNRFLMYKNIKINRLCVQVNSNEPFKRPDYLLINRNQEVA